MPDLFFLHLLLLTSLLYSQAPHSKADEALINKVCGATPDAVRCSLCIRSHPNGYSADGKALARIFSDCAQSDTAQLRDTIFTLATRAPDENSKAALTSCEDKVVSAWTYYFVLQVNLDNASYDEALKTIRENIGPKINECRPDGKLPREVLTGVAYVNTDLIILVSIIGQIR
uniref:Pectinesterase inhibitor domain-containing protein n=1 Tax=Kalanchoe fedtschenkoi TaxID=63787 RepID=A0A7N0SYU3_KALFE